MKTNPPSEDFTEKREELVAKLQQSMSVQLRHSGYTLLKAGQRSGKSYMSRNIARKLANNYEHIVLLRANTGNYHNDFFSDLCDHMSHFSVKAQLLNVAEIQALRNMELHKAIGQVPFGRIMDEKILIIFDEPFWVENSFSIFTELMKCGHVIVVGSNGPSYDNNWRFVPGYSFATWDMNPYILREEIERHNLQDKAAFERDYCAF